MARDFDDDDFEDVQDAKDDGGDDMFTSELPTVGGQIKPGTPVWGGRVDPPWYWVASPKRWGIIGDRIVPVLSKIVLNPNGGIGGVDGDGQSAYPEVPVAAAAQRGEVVIRWEDPRFLVTLPDGKRVHYLRKVKGRGGYVSAWQTPDPATDECVIDIEGYASWLRSLIDAGIIPPVTKPVLENLRKSVLTAIDKYEDTSVNLHTARYARLKEELAIIDAELDRFKRKARAVPAAPVEFEEASLPVVPTDERAPTSTPKSKGK